MRQDAPPAKCMALQHSSGLWMARLWLWRWQQQFCLVASIPTRVTCSALQLARQRHWRGSQPAGDIGRTGLQQQVKERQLPALAEEGLQGR